MAESLSVVSPEFKQRLDEILQRKREEAITRESERKSKFARYGDDV
ncbi:hypothetical protein DP44_790 [Burkholderia pseudomallei]|nr:hypothetical protein DP44_790 [Burkholderia pseudomallei]